MALEKHAHIHLFGCSLSSKPTSEHEEQPTNAVVLTHIESHKSNGFAHVLFLVNIKGVNFRCLRPLTSNFLLVCICRILYDSGRWLFRPEDTMILAQAERQERRGKSGKETPTSKTDSQGQTPLSGPSTQGPVIV